FGYPCVKFISLECGVENRCCKYQIGQKNHSFSTQNLEITALIRVPARIFSMRNQAFQGQISCFYPDALTHW
ncbi:hypothetical protein L9F63_016429, partial [Diploptera punctata]